MASLYKRYIPPKQSDATTPTLRPPIPSAKTVSQPTLQDEPKKRKRERSEEEIAERKEKKLRKKGLDPTTVLSDNPISANGNGPTQQPHALHVNGENPNGEPPSQFAHVKNTKKRHKLEKEARKARKATKKSIEEEDLGDGADGRSEANGHLEDQPEPSNSQSIGDEAVFDKRSGIDAVVEPKKHKRRQKTVLEGRKGKSEDILVDAETAESVDSVPDNTKRQQIKDGALNELNNPTSEQQRNRGITETTDEPYDSTLSQPKKRRHKLESVLQQSGALDEHGPGNEDEHLRKHTSLLGKFQKSTKLSRNTEIHDEQQKVDATTKTPIVSDLTLPEKPAAPEFQPDPSALPSWLANPKVVSNEDKQMFADLNLNTKIVERLSKLGLSDALPVQQALIPVLLPPGLAGSSWLPRTEAVLPDVAVSAPTGSGKTIAYLLPIIESLKTRPSLGRLRALVIVPTRELVVQVAAVAESLVKGSDIRVGMATGTSSLRDDQAKLIKKGRNYDPENYHKLIMKAHKMNYPPAEESEDYDDFLRELEERDAREEQRIQDTVSGLVEHVPTYGSAVDLLIATPGRLLEHLSSMLGFSLARLQWLVLDEADKLLDQQYDGFLQTVNHEISRPCKVEEMDAREHYLASKGVWDERKERRVRKVVLSATMSRDVSKLAGLELKRPRLIVVRGSDQDDATSRGAEPGATNVNDIADDFELPPRLHEFCVPVGDGSEKPLYLIELLEKRILNSPDKIGANDNGDADIDADSDSEDFSTTSDSASESESSSSSESSLSTSSEETSTSEDSASSTPEKDENEALGSIHPDRSAMIEGLPHRPNPSPAPATPPTVLVFASSTESAHRLSHLLKELRRDWAPFISTMTKTMPRRGDNTHAAAKPTDPIVTISTDRAARGLDALAARPVTHVLQYDVPRSATGYVHRVGRTARAGRPGQAWTLFTHSEARWFLREVARSPRIRRGGTGGVEKVRLPLSAGGEMREKLDEVLAGMRSEVLGRGG